MRDFSADTSALALNTATLGHNLDGYGAGWPVERVIVGSGRPADWLDETRGSIDMAAAPETRS